MPTSHPTGTQRVYYRGGGHPPRHRTWPPAEAGLSFHRTSASPPIYYRGSAARIHAPLARDLCSSEHPGAHGDAEAIGRITNRHPTPGPMTRSPVHLTHARSAPATQPEVAAPRPSDHRHAHPIHTHRDRGSGFTSRKDHRFRAVRPARRIPGFRTGPLPPGSSPSRSDPNTKTARSRARR